MKERTRRILIMAVMAALIVSLMAASFSCIFTYGRYSGGRRDENSPYEDYIDFVGATAFTVKTPEELTNAIENGYSYIEIDEGAEEPFVVNDDIANVTTNLVLDVNGTTVIRNSRNPLLDVKRSVSVVLVYDSSTEQAGGFYNPVGSALQTSGGTLTVGAGVYESGPRTKPSSSVSGNVSATVYSREVRTGKEYTLDESTTQLPKLEKDVYLKNDVTEGYLRNDTYLIYTKENNCYEKDGKLFVNCTKTGTGTDTKISGTSFSVESNVASCDFYYYYPVSGTAGTEDAFQEYAVVYGYHDVKALARDEKKTDENGTEYGMASALQDDGLVWPYAAIRSEAGNTHARGGAFKTHFGEENTYCIYSAGGTMTVGSAGSSPAAGPAFKAVGEGVCISMSAEDEDTLTISGGSFSSEIGNTIEMEGGAVKITGGAFEKNDSNARPSGTLDEIEASRTALVHMRGGDLTIDGTVTGANYSVTMAAGSEQTPLTNVFGIYSEQSSLGDSGTVTVSGCDISVNGTYSAGVLSSAGTVNVGGTENGKPQTKITVAESIEDDLLTSSAVSSEGGIVNLRNTVSITSDSLGITARGTVNVIGGEMGGESTTVTVTTSNATGVYVNNGTLNVAKGATLDVESTVKAELKWVTPPESSGSSDPVTQIYNGVFVHGGSLISNGTLNVTFKGVASDNTTGSNAYLNHQIRSHAVRVEQGTGTDTIVAIASGTILNGTRDTNDTVIAESGIGGGVLVNGGTVYLGATVSLDNSGNIVAIAVNNPVSVTTTGTANHGWNGVDFPTANGEQRNNWDYRVTQTGGDAVKVVNGQLTVYGGSYTSSQGNGIAIQQTTGTATATVYGGTFSGDDVYSDNTQNNSFYTGPGASYAFKVLSGTLTIYDGIFTSNDGGAFVMNGTATMYGGIIAAQGATAFVTYTAAKVTFDPTTELNVAGVRSTGRTLYVSGASSGLTVEKTSEIAQEIKINGGTFTGGTYSFTAEDQAYSVQGSGSSRNGIWYGNGGATLEITDGTFQGENVSGLYFQVAPDGNNVQLSGGTYYGKDNDVRLTHSWGVPQPSNNSTYNAIDGNENIAYSQLLVSGHSANGDTEYNGSVNDGSDSADGDYTTQTGGLGQVKDKGSVQVERYGIWYSIYLVYSKITISNS